MLTSLLHVEVELCCSCRGRVVLTSLLHVEVRVVLFM